MSLVGAGRSAAGLPGGGWVLPFKARKSLAFVGFATAGLLLTAPSTALGQDLNLAGSNFTFTFPATTIDPNTPYTNTGGLNQAATLTLRANGFTGEEQGDAIQGGGNQISLEISGPGTIVLQDTNTYTGPTTISAGTLALATFTFGSGEFATATKGSIANSSAVLIGAGGTLDISQAHSETPSSGPAVTGGASITTLGDLSSAAPFGAVSLGSQALTITNGSTTFSGTIQDGGIVGETGGSLVIAGGTQTLAGANTYTGGTTINAGTLQIGNGGATGSIVGNVLDNSALAFDRSDNVTFGGVISGTGSLTQLGAGTLILTGTNTYAGGTTISTGTLQIGNGGTTGSIVGDVLDNSALAFDRSDNVTFGGVIRGRGSLAQLGAGTLTLLGANSSYSGGTTVERGTLVAVNPGALGTGPVMVVGGSLEYLFNNPTVVNLSGAGLVTGALFPFIPVTPSLELNNSANSTFAGVIEDWTVVGKPTPTNVEVTGSGGSVLTLSGTNTYTGGTTIAAGGTLQLGDGATTGSIVGNVADNGVLAFDRSDTVTFPGIISGSGSLTQLGGGTLTLSGSNTYTGATTVDAGTLKGGAANTFSAASLTTINAGGTLDLGGLAQTINAVSLAGGTIQDGSLTGAIFSGGGTVNGIGGAASLTLLEGISSLQGSNTYTGATLIGPGTTLLGRAANAFSPNSATTVNAGGTLDLGGFNQTVSSLSGAGTVTNNTLSFSFPPPSSPATLTNEGASSTFSGVIQDGAASFCGFECVPVLPNPTSLDQNSPGNTLTLGGANTYTGSTTVSAGTLEVSGSIGSAATPSGAIDIGAAGAFFVNAGGSIDIGSALITNAGTLTNDGSIIAGALSNLAGASLTNNGTLTDDLSNFGTVVNNELYRANVAFNSGTIINAGTWVGNVNIGANVADGLIINKRIWEGTGYNAGGSIDNQAKAQWVGGIVNTSGTFSNEGTVSAGLINSGAATNSGEIFGGVSNSAAFTTTGVINGGLANTGTVNASGAINGAIQNFNGFTLTGDLASDGFFTNNGVVRTSQPAVTLATSSFNNNGVLDLRNPGTAATNLTIAGNYFGGPGSIIALNVFGQQANHLSVTGSANGTSFVSVSPLIGAFAPLSNPIPIISAGSGAATFAVAPGPPSLVNYTIRQIDPDPVYVLTGSPNLAVIGSIASGPRSAIESVTSGFFEGLYTVFQGSGPFLGAPPTPKPNQIDAGVWTRAASGMNTEHSVVADNMGSDPVGLRNQTHFGGFQVGSDLGIFNVQNNGWNVHGGVTGGEYQASVGDSSLGAANSSYSVPFLGLYGAVLGHGFFGDVMVRHDFWQGNVSSPEAGLTGARLNGSANAVTAEAGYTFHFQNGLFATPSLGFSYTSASFDNLTLAPGTPFAPTLNLGGVKSELGRVGLTVGDTFATPYWTLTPNLNGSIWHEFAGETSSTLNVAAPGEFFTDTVTESRLGTFGQIGLGVLAQPVLNPNWTLFARADYRTGSNIYGATITAGFRYQF